MRIRIIQLGAVIGVIASLTGCFEEKVPEPTAENCSAEIYEKNLASLSKEASRNEFTTGCKGFLKAQKMTKWKFEKSPEDKY